MKINWLISFVLLLGSCKESRSSLSKEQYKDIILDLQVAETIILNSTLSNKDSLREVLQSRIGQIYGFKDIPSMQASLMPLEKDPELMLEITKAINKKLDEMEDSIKLGVE